MSKKKEPEFVLTWKITSTTRGEPAQPFEAESHSLNDAVLQFHASRQLLHGLKPDDYQVVAITTNHAQPQHYDRFDLLPKNPDVLKCTFTKRLHKQYTAELEKLGVEVKVA